MELCPKIKKNEIFNITIIIWKYFCKNESQSWINTTKRDEVEILKYMRTMKNDAKKTLFKAFLIIYKNKKKCLIIS